jgi:hypothetical protein
MGEHKGKKPQNFKPKSYLHIYLKVWMLLLVLLLGSVFFTNSTSDQTGNYFGAYFILTGLSLVFISAFEGNRFLEYLKKNHYSKWAEVRFNNFKSLGFLFSDDYLNDPYLKDLKKIIGNAHIFIFLVFVSLPILAVFLIIAKLVY